MPDDLKLASDVKRPVDRGDIDQLFEPKLGVVAQGWKQVGQRFRRHLGYGVAMILASAKIRPASMTLNALKNGRGGQRW